MKRKRADQVSKRWLISGLPVVYVDASALNDFLNDLRGRPDAFDSRISATIDCISHTHLELVMYAWGPLIVHLIDRTYRCDEAGVFLECPLATARAWVREAVASNKVLYAQRHGG